MSRSLSELYDLYPQAAKSVHCVYKNVSDKTLTFSLAGDYYYLEPDDICIINSNLDAVVKRRGLPLAECSDYFDDLYQDEKTPVEIDTPKKKKPGRKKKNKKV